VHELATELADIRAFYTFRVQGRLYGIDLSQVREVSTQTACTPVPQAPPLVCGLTNLRSRIYLVLDIGTAVRGERSQRTADSRLIVLQERLAAGLALLVDRGGDLVRVPADQIEEAAADAAAPPADSRWSAVTALCKLEGELMMVVDPTRIVAALETAIR
jgi:purine-binding chemotaxis protein CheW